MVQITGKYTFVSQDKFEDYLKAADVGMIKRNVIASTKPDIIIEATGDNYTVTTVTSLKTIKISFTLGKEYEADPGTDKTSTYITTLEGGDTLVTKDIKDSGSVATRKFTDDGFVMTMTTKGVSATRTFKRA